MSLLLATVYYIVCFIVNAIADIIFVSMPKLNCPSMLRHPTPHVHNVVYDLSSLVKKQKPLSNL